MAGKRKVNKSKHRREERAAHRAPGARPPLSALVHGRAARVQESTVAEGEKLYTGNRDEDGYFVEVEEGVGEDMMAGGAYLDPTDYPAQYAGEFGWGDAGPAAQELARHLLADCLGPEYLGRGDLHERFAQNVLARFKPEYEWQITSTQIREWLESEQP